MKRDIGKRMAFAGLGTAFSVLFVALSYYVSNLTLSFTVLAGIGTMLPLTKKYYREALLCCIATIIIGFFIANIKILPYVLASSFYIVFTIFYYEKKYNKLIGYGIKILYSFLVFYILYSLTSLIVVDVSQLSFFDNVNKTGLYIVFNLIFTFCYIVYDILMIQVYLYLVKIVNKIVKN